MTDLCLHLSRSRQVHGSDGRPRESKVAEPVQSLSEGENPTPGRACGSNRHVLPSVQHHAETLVGEKERGCGAANVSPQKSASPNQRTCPGVHLVPRSSASLLHTKSSAPTNPRGRPGQNQPPEHRGALGRKPPVPRGTPPPATHYGAMKKRRAT